jgi:hypothetical protein
MFCTISLSFIQSSGAFIEFYRFLKQTPLMLHPAAASLSHADNIINCNAIQTDIEAEYCVLVLNSASRNETFRWSRDRVPCNNIGSAWM